MSYSRERSALLRSVPCARCGAAVGETCRNLHRPTEHAQFAHMARVWAVDRPGCAISASALHGGRWGVR